MMKAISTSETSANFYHVTRRIILFNGHLSTRRRKNLKSRSVNLYGEATVGHIQKFEALKTSDAEITHRPDNGGSKHL
jgi:hypothetical protein